MTQPLVEVVIRDPANPTSIKVLCKNVTIERAFSTLMTTYAATRGLEIKEQIPDSAVSKMLDSIYDKILKNE